MTFPPSLKSRSLPSENPNCDYALVSTCSSRDRDRGTRFSASFSPPKLVLTTLMWSVHLCLLSTQRQVAEEENFRGLWDLRTRSQMKTSCFIPLVSEDPGPCFLSLHLPSKRPKAFCCPLGIAQYTLKATRLAKLSHFIGEDTKVSETPRGQWCGWGPTAILDCSSLPDAFHIGVFRQWVHARNN